MPLRTTAWLMVAALAALAVLATLSLLRASDRLHEVSGAVLESTESVQATHELEASLLLHNRESRLWGTTNAETHLTRRELARDRIQRWLEEAREHIASAEEAALLAKAEDAVQRYFTRRSLLEQRGVAPTEIDAQIAEDVDEAMNRLDALTAINMSQAHASYARSVHLDEATHVFGLVVIALILSASALMLLLFRRLVYVPVLHARASMQAFRAGKPVTAITSGASELRELSEVFADVVAQLRRQRENQVRYIAAVAHDLRNPISAICMGTDVTVAEHGRALPPEVQETLELVQRQALLLDRMVADLLDTARSEGGQLELRRQVRDVVPVVKESCDLFRGYSKNHELVFEAPPEPLCADVDALRLAQVVNNLISNAIKYSPLGGRIHLRLAATPAAITVAVTDPGLGIAPDDHERIFEPFRRATATKDAIPGVGLGLFTARKIALAHGGRLGLTSTPGHGSTFTLHLPRAMSEKLPARRLRPIPTRPVELGAAP